MYKLSFELAVKIFTVSNLFTNEEAYRKRLYPAHFISKIAGADMENSEKQTWLKFALACAYNDKGNYTQPHEYVGTGWQSAEPYD